MKILVFGDSIGYGYYDDKGGWTRRLIEHCEEKNGPRVINLSVDGSTTKDVIKTIRADVEKVTAGSESTVIIALGINDSSVLHSSKNFIIPLPDFNLNINWLINEVRNLTPNVIFVGLAPIVEEKLQNWKDERSYSSEFVNEFDSVIRNLCQHKRVPYIDLRDLTPDDLHKDGLHPNSSGHKKIFERVRDVLLKRKLI